jgi:hypothetical protein
MTRAEKYEEIFGLPCHKSCITVLCKDCPINGSCSSSKVYAWWDSEYSPAKPDDTPKITINFSNTSKESICDELIGFITTAFSPNNSIQYALGISDCLKMIEDFKKEASKE